MMGSASRARKGSATIVKTQRTDMLRVLASGPVPPPINGMSVAFALLTRELTERGWRVDVANITDGSGRRSGAFSLGRVRQVIGAAAASWRHLLDCDVVYITIAQSRNGFFRDLLTIVPALGTRRPIVVHLHGGNFSTFYNSEPRLIQMMLREALSRVARIIVLTDAMRSDFAMLDDWQSKTVAVDNATSVPTLEARAVPKKHLRLLYLSSLMAQKGYLDVLAAAADIGRRRPEWRISIEFAGDFRLGVDDFDSVEAMRDDFAARVAALPKNVAATWHGVVDGTRKLELLRDADALLLPTYYVNEGQPICIIEALASGLPVITTDFRGIRATLPESFAPLLVPPHDPIAIADRIEMLFSDASLYARLSRDAVAQAPRFSVDAHVSAIESIFSAACNA